MRNLDNLTNGELALLARAHATSQSSATRDDADRARMLLFKRTGARDWNHYATMNGVDHPDKVDHDKDYTPDDYESGSRAV